MAESEFILLRRFTTNGDAEAFSQIIKQHAPMVYGVCLRILANREIAADVVQDTFFQLVRDASDITGSLPNWLHKAATHRAIDVVRSDSQRKQRELIYASNPGNADSEDKKAAWREISVCIDEELENLDDQTKEVLILRFFEGLTTTDIAQKCNISQPTASRWIESGIELLRLKLKSRGVIVPAAVFMTLLSENILKAAPASIMKELGKIAMAGNKTTIAGRIASSISMDIAVKTKIMVGVLIVLLGAGLTVVFTFIANGDNTASPWELVQQSLKKQPDSEPNKNTESKPDKNIANITVKELLDNYTKALDSIQSFIGTFESSTVATFDVPGMGVRANESRSFMQGEYRSDGKGKTYQNHLRWGDIGMNEPNVPKSKASYKYIVADDDFLYNHTDRLNMTEYNGRESHGSIYYLTPDIGEYFQLSINDYGTLSKSGALGYFLGYFDNRARIDNTLKNEAKQISVRKEPEMINGSVCFVVEADTKRGDYTIWLDSEHGFHPARIKAKMGTGDDAGEPGSPRILTQEDGAEAEYTLDNVRFEKIEGFWVPMEADSERRVIQEIMNSFEDDHIHFKFTKITLNPDHEALNSFGNPIENPELDPELDDGTKVDHLGYESATWIDGKVIDNYGYEIDLNNRGPKVVVGHVLPDLSEFNVRLDPGLTQNRRLLICFWDRNQRPSRNAILSLNEKANSLLEKGLYMFFIHAGAIEEKTFTSWLKRNEIKPPAGISRDGLPGLEYTWGVQSLPWLILTDKNHVVIAEGFSITELDEKLKN